MARPKGVYVALLRGVNVGGRNRLPMQGLSEVFLRTGCTRVQTYIQSGNVVFQASDGVARQLPALALEGISKRFGLKVPVVVRTAAELKSAARANPFALASANLDLLHVVFLAGRPTAAQVDSLDPHRSPPDEFRVNGREVYLRLPNGAARSKFTNAYFDAKLATTSTVRNWRTVLKLLEMATAQNAEAS